MNFINTQSGVNFLMDKFTDPNQKKKKKNTVGTRAHCFILEMTVKKWERPCKTVGLEQI